MKQGDFDERFGIPYQSLSDMVKDGFKNVSYNGMKGPEAAAALVVLSLKNITWRQSAQEKQAKQREKNKLILKRALELGIDEELGLE
jgi:uncharacterized membrane protein|tara:strand:- start:128 stop:388 length:261 start_codon:yes stop_codon:yes gene_type:complete